MGGWSTLGKAVSEISAERLLSEILWSKGCRKKFPHGRGFVGLVGLDHDDFNIQTKLGQDLPAATTGSNKVFTGEGVVVAVLNPQQSPYL